MILQPVIDSIRDVPDFPIEGVMFKDIAPVLGNPELLSLVIDYFADRHQDAGIQKVAGIEARGFIFGAALAYRLGVGFIPIRKKGKLPWKTVEESYDLEYGTATIEIHQDAAGTGERVLLIDDLLATGGTAAAAIKLLESLGVTIVEVDFLVELAFLEGRQKLPDHVVHAPIVY